MERSIWQYLATSSKGICKLLVHVDACKMPGRQKRMVEKTHVKSQLSSGDLVYLKLFVWP